MCSVDERNCLNRHFASPSSFSSLHTAHTHNSLIANIHPMKYLYHPPPLPSIPTYTPYITTTLPTHMLHSPPPSQHTQPTLSITLPWPTTHPSLSSTLPTHTHSPPSSHTHPAVTTTLPTHTLHSPLPSQNTPCTHHSIMFHVIFCRTIVIHLKLP